MKIEDEILHEKLAALFKEEAAEHLKNLNDGLFVLEKSPSFEHQPEIIQSLFRSAHSLKGAARAINHHEIEVLCSTLEEALDTLKKGKISITPQFLEILFNFTDHLETIIFGNKETFLSKKKGTYSTTGLIKNLEDLITQAKNNECSPNPPYPEDNSLPVDEEKPPSLANPADFQEKTHLLEKEVARDTIRVSSKKIDKLLQHVEEMLTIKSSSQQKIKELEMIQSLLTDWSDNTWHQNLENSFQEMCFSFRNTVSRDQETLQSFINQLNAFFLKKMELFHAITEKLRALRRSREKDHRMVCSLVDNVIIDTKEILMQPFATLVDGMPKMARELSHSLNKNVTLEILGDEIEVDRRILEKLKDPLIHLLRNSLDHGIEEPQERQRNHKNPKGIIKISTRQVSGNAFEVTIADDGKGIDFAKIKERAIKEGLISQEEQSVVSEEQLIKLLFKPGFSTSPIVSDISGRGIGLNVVKENVEKLGGTVTVNSKIGEGAAFIITTPLTLATFRGIHIKTSGHEFIIPTHHVVRVLRMPEEKITTVENHRSVTIENLNYAFLELHQILGLPKQVGEQGPSLKPILLITASDLQIAIGVDAIYSEQEVFVKGLGKQLQRVRNIAATTIMEWGKVIPILDPFDLVKSAVSATVLPLDGSEENLIQKTVQKSILIVEDSITSRMLLKNILEASGYKVKSAVDGVEGFDKLQKETADLVLSDVEMPRMNGFELTTKIRSSEKYRDIPIILCTSRGSQEDREQGIAVGANAYVDKSNFKQQNLLEIIGQLLD